MMERVTDPKLIEKLNSMVANQQLNQPESNEFEGKTRVTDPDLISKLNSMSNNKNKYNGYNYAKDLALSNNPINLLRNITIGLGRAGHGIANSLTRGYAPPDTTEELIGQKNPSKSDEVVRDISQYLPFALAGGAGLIPSTLAAGAYGVTQSENPLKAGLGYAAANALTHGALSIFPKFMPGRAANKLTQSISGNSKNLEENAQSLSSDIYNAHKVKLEEALDHINPVLQKYGKEEIYPLVNKSGYHAVREFPEIELETADSQLKKNFNKFKSSPTFENAHNLQSEIGSEIGYWKKQPPSDEKYKALSSLKPIRDEIKKGMNSFLGKVEPEMANHYKQFSKLFEENVVPYRSDKTLRAIAEGKETNPKNIHTIFEYPTNVLNRKTGEISKGPINKILEHLPEESKNKILYSKIGGIQEDANKLLESLENARNKGYSSYFNKELQDKVKALDKAVKNKKLLKNVGTLAGVGGIGGIGGAAYNKLTKD